MDQAPYYGTFFVQQLPSSLISPWSSRWPRWQYLSLSNCLKTQRRTIQKNLRHFIRLIETRRQICQIFLCSAIFFLFASSISTPVSAITSKLALRVKFATEFYKSNITPDLYRLSKCPVRCLIYLCIRKSSIKNKQFDLKQWRGIYILLLNKRRAGLK